MVVFKFNPAETGLRKTLRAYEEIALKYIWYMDDEGVLGFRDATGKGGHHRIYITKLDESGYKKYIVRTLLESVMKDYPKETDEVLQAL